MPDNSTGRNFHFPLATFATVAVNAADPATPTWDHFGPAYVNLLTKGPPTGPSWTSLAFLPNPLVQNTTNGPAPLQHSLHIGFGECKGNVKAAWLDDWLEVKVELVGDDDKREGGWMGVRLQFEAGLMELLRFVSKLPKDWDTKQASPGSSMFKWDKTGAPGTSGVVAGQDPAPAQTGWADRQVPAVKVSEARQFELSGLSEEELGRELLRTLCGQGMDAVVRQVWRALNAK